MKRLNENWLLENHIDFEYKKYLLLAYLQGVYGEYEQAKLYPHLSDLLDHFRSAKAIKDSKDTLYSKFPSSLSGTDLARFQLIYDKSVGDDNVMEELNQIISFSIPLFEKALGEGRSIYDFIEKHINIEPVGIVPLSVAEGYLFLRNGATNLLDVYQYGITIFEKSNEKYRAINTEFISRYTTSISTTIESVKTELIHYRKNILPNPATYLLEADMAFPFNESLLPVAKRTLVKYISSQD